MRFGKLHLAVIVAAALACAPVMARSLDSPAFTEKIEQKAVSSSAAAETKISPPAQTDAGMVIKFDQRMVQYAVLPAVTRQMVAFDQSSTEFVSINDRQALAMIGDMYRNTDTT
jgi:hypothetical protein